MSTPSELLAASPVPVLELAASASSATRSSPGLTSHITTAPVVTPRRHPQQVCRAKSCNSASCKEMVQTLAPCLVDAPAADDLGSAFIFPSPRRVARAQIARRDAPMPLQLQFPTALATLNTNMVPALPHRRSSRPSPSCQPVQHHLPLRSKPPPPRPPLWPTCPSGVQQLQCSPMPLSHAA